MRNLRWYLLAMTFIILFVLGACGDSEEGQMNENESQTDQNNEQFDEEEEESSQEENESNSDSNEEVESREDNSEESEEVSFEVQTAPEDQGDLEVWLEGELTVDKNAVIVEGITNLLPEAKLKLDIDSKEAIIIGGGWTTERVQENGEFYLEQPLPDNLEGLIHVELMFEVGDQKEEIMNHYVDQISGNFIQKYAEDEEESYHKATFQRYVFLNEETQTFEIAAPEWEIPEDQGSTTVRLEPEITREDKYLVVHLNSNLIDGTYVRADIDIPNYMVSGYWGEDITKRDGSAMIYVRDPEQDSRIKNLEEYFIEITVDPTSSNNGAHVTEIYGANGENLTGDLAKETDEGKEIKQTITITAE